MSANPLCTKKTAHLVITQVKQFQSSPEFIGLHQRYISTFSPELVDKFIGQIYIFTVKETDLLFLKV